MQKHFTSGSKGVPQHPSLRFAKQGKKSLAWMLLLFIPYGLADLQSLLAVRSPYVWGLLWFHISVLTYVTWVLKGLSKNVFAAELLTALAVTPFPIERYARTCVRRGIRLPAMLSVAAFVLAVMQLYAAGSLLPGRPRVASSCIISFALCEIACFNSYIVSFYLKRTPTMSVMYQVGFGAVWKEAMRILSWSCTSAAYQANSMEDLGLLVVIPSVALVMACVSFVQVRRSMSRLAEIRD